MAKRNPWKKMVNNMSQQERADALQNLGASDPAAARRVQTKDTIFNPHRYIVTSTYREPITGVVASRGGSPARRMLTGSLPSSLHEGAGAT